MHAARVLRGDAAAKCPHGKPSHDKAVEYPHTADEGKLKAAQEVSENLEVRVLRSSTLLHIVYCSM